MFTSLSGYRTYILAGAALAVIAGNLLGMLDVSNTNILLQVLGFGSIIALRAGVAAN